MTCRLIAIVAGAVLVAGVAAAIVVSLGSSGGERWTIRDLGTLPGFRSCNPVAINDSGLIVGSCDTGGAPLDEHGFLWQAGRMTDLGRGNVPSAINERGQVAGSGQRRAFLWQHGKITPLVTAGDRSYATAINDRGEIVGDVWTSGGGRAVLWRAGKAIDLGISGEPSAINAQGEIVAVGPGASSADAFVWRAGKATDLGSFSLSSESIAVNDAGQVVASGAHGAFLWQNGRFTRFGSELSDGLAINDRGQILLEAEKGSDKRGDAFLWQNGKLTKLPALDDDTPGTFARAMNGRGQIIGSSVVEVGHSLPFVWERGKMTALSTLSRQDTPPWSTAVAINDHGQIVGTSYVDVNGRAEQHVVLWTSR
jgi:probable HAF family extracellular repeat protein